MKYQKYYSLIEEQSKVFDKENNCECGQVWKYHLLPVIENAKKLAKIYNADEDIVEVSALFHDYADLISIKNRENHHILGAKLAEKILLEDGFDKNFIEKVKTCILNHRGSITKEKNSIEEICVANADAMAHLENVVDLIFWRIKSGDTVEECNKFIKDKIIKSYNKMSDKTKNLMKDKYESIMKILY